MSKVKGKVRGSGAGKVVVLAACGVLALMVILGLGGFSSPFPDSEITHLKPYADFVGRQYRVTSAVSAYFWNAFPDKTKIVSISLIPPPGVNNRFISSVTPLQQGQRLRIVSAWQHFVLFGFSEYYVVAVPGAGLPEGVRITIAVNSDGVPDPRVYAPIPPTP